MKILHVSDLHITAPDETLESVWNGPSSVLDEGTFDFVIVSGDLAQRASEPEYARLLEFARTRLLKLLTPQHNRERARVIFVPGNHDVDWEAPIGDEVPLADYVKSEGVRDPRRFLTELQRAPDRAGARHVIAADGSNRIVRIDPERYRQRFHNLQTHLLTPFYEHGMAGPSRPFDLTSPDDADHWSAHVFADEGVAFYGFNSCHRNDRHWHGATISRLAIIRAAEHARTHARKLLRVAVWHHGITGEPGRPDHLTLLDIGELHNAGFRIGFHGHTHEAAGEILDRFFGDRFVVVSTGSIGARSEERPDAVGRQFSIVKLFPGQANVEVWERRNVGVFRRAGEPRFYLLPQGDGRRPRISRAGAHRREIHVHSTGIADVRVQIDDLTVEGGLTLAVIPKHAGMVWAPNDAETHRGLWRVVRDDRPDGTVRYALAANEAFTESLTWSYSISNAHLLAAEELRFVTRDERMRPGDVHLDEEEYRSHEVHIPTDRLTISITYDPSLPGIDPQSVRPIVDHRRTEGGNEWWESVPRDAFRSLFRVTAQESHRVVCEVDAPLLDHRYTVAYRLRPRVSSAHDREAEFIARAVLERTRSERTGAHGLSELLSRTLDEGIASVFPDSELTALSVVGFVWHPEERHLLAAYGRLNNSHWGTRFSFGAGVAGHAFRFASTATWHQRRRAKSSLIYRPSVEGQHIYGTEHPHQWIVCVPILALSGEAIGVVSFGSREANSDVEFTLASYAEHPSDARSQLEQNLRFAVNYAFWEALAPPKNPDERAPELLLPSALGEYAQRMVAWLDRSVESEPPDAVPNEG